MFKHDINNDKEKLLADSADNKPAPVTPPVQGAIRPKEVSFNSLQELLEKNLKWSQIIYEQNRRINHKLLWTAIAGWVRVLLILLPFIAAVWFLPPVIRDLKVRYDFLLNPQNKKIPDSTINDIMKILPLSPAEKNQIKAILTK